MSARWEGEFAIKQRIGHGIVEGETRGMKKAACGMLEAGISRELTCKALKVNAAELTALLATNITESTDPAKAANTTKLRPSPPPL